MIESTGKPPADAVIVACRRLHAAIDTLDQAAADLLGVSRTDLRCLNLLETGALPPGRIGAALGLSSGSVTALVDRLEGKGLVRRDRAAGDRRSVLVAVTPLAFRTVGALYRACADRLRSTVDLYPQREQADAIRHLNDVAAAWEGADPRSA